MQTDPASQRRAGWDYEAGGGADGCLYLPAQSTAQGLPSAGWGSGIRAATFEFGTNASGGICQLTLYK